MMTMSVFSQNYIHAAGLRGGVYNGFNYKNFFSNSVAFEGILLKPWKAFDLTLLVEKYHPVDRSRNFFLYYGIGGLAGFYDARYANILLFRGEMLLSDLNMNSAEYLLLSGLIGNLFTIL